MLSVVLALQAVLVAAVLWLATQQIGLRRDLGDVKVALARLEGRLDTEMAGVRTEFAAVRSEISDLRVELRTEIAAVRSEISDLRVELVDRLDQHLRERHI